MKINETINPRTEQVPLISKPAGHVESHNTEDYVAAVESVISEMREVFISRLRNVLGIDIDANLVTADTVGLLFFLIREELQK